MEKKNTLLVAVLLVLVLVYVAFFTDWFRPRMIKLFYTTRHIEYYRARPDLPYVLFGLEGNYRLTEVKVVSLDDLKGNPNPLPQWHLISKSNSVPIRMFTYGEHIHGMRAAFKGEEAQALMTNEMYRLFVSAGKARGQIDFKIK
ncbi:MAG TPA: hypothetical protein VGV18_13040 [Verrucomicrobiae bacterium]|nr:hypothetical protein [Verrucomicrobiae bacterium]